MKFPLPNDVISGAIVVASVTYIDDERGEIALVLLLRQQPPYFEVAHYALTGFDPKLSSDEFLQGGLAMYEGEIDSLGEFLNIVPAVKAYEENGGDY